MENIFYTPAQKLNYEKTKYEIDNQHECFLEIVIRGEITKHIFLATLSELVNHPEFYEKHILLNILNAQIALNFAEMKEIAGVMRLYTFQEKITSKKFAVLASGAFTVSVAQMGIDLFSYLPLEYNTFNDSDDAINFLKGYPTTA